MANQNDPIFNIDASQILAKLHLSAQQQIQPPNFIINTGITNPVDKGDPNNLGNTLFDLKNASHVYEVGIARTDFAYYPPFDLKQNSKIEKQTEAVRKAEEEYKKLSDQLKELDKSASLTDNNIEKKKESLKKKKLEARKKTIAEQKKTIDVVKNTIGVFADKEAADIFNNDKDILDPESKITDEEKKKMSPIQIQMKNIKFALKKENEFRKQQKIKNLENWSNTTFKTIQTYFESFCGKQNASKIKKNEVVVKFIDTSMKIKSSTTAQDIINNYQITPLNNEDIQKGEKESFEKDPKKPFRPIVSWCVGYEVEIETM